MWEPLPWRGCAAAGPESRATSCAARGGRPGAPPIRGGQAAPALERQAVLATHPTPRVALSGPVGRPSTARPEGPLEAAPCTTAHPVLPAPLAAKAPRSCEPAPYALQS